jgi:hypothetical protein
VELENTFSKLHIMSNAMRNDLSDNHSSCAGGGGKTSGIFWGRALPPTCDVEQFCCNGLHGVTRSYMALHD